MVKPLLRLRTLLLLLTLSATPLHAQDTKNRPEDLVDLAKMVLEFVDTISMRGLDPDYLTLPEKPWQLILRSNLNQSRLSLFSVTEKAFLEDNTLLGRTEWEARFMTAPSYNVGLWGGYRGYGLGYTFNLSRDKNYLLTLGLTGGSYGLNMRIHNFHDTHSDVHYKIDASDETYREEVNFGEPVNARNLIIDGYYAFNGKRFSYCAAYDQSVIQRHSAGSLLVGGMYYYSNINYEQDGNALLMLLMNDIGRVRQWQWSVGAGYAYNYVPSEGFLISGLVMPMVTVVNRIEATRYGSNLRDYVYDPENHSQPEQKDYKIWYMDEQKQTGKISMNFDARLSLTYLWKDYFLNIYGQYYNVRFRDGTNSGNHSEWSVNTSLGIRL